MSDFAILVRGEGQTPAVVRMNATDNALQLIGINGPVETIPWWRLYRVDDGEPTHRFRSLGERNWELRVMSGADQQLLAHVGPRRLHKIIHSLRRLEALKVAAAMLVLLVTIAQHAPPEWVARSIPDWAQNRLVDGMIADDAPFRCNHEGGEAAVRKLLVRLDPELGPKVDVVALREGAFVVSSVPGSHIFMYRSSMTEIDPAALPALLAHELSHIRHGDPITAVVRQNGYISTWAAILQAAGDRKLLMQFSGLEERRADLEAMQMMRRAGMPLKPAADMFEKMRISKEQGGYFGYDDRDFHFGIEARAERWATAAARFDTPRPVPLLTRDEEDALYNFCWTGPLPPLRKGEARAPPDTTQPGTGVLAPSSAVPAK